MNRKVLSLTYRATRLPNTANSDVVQLISKLDRAITAYFHTTDHLADVLDFLIQVRKNIKWDVEMNQCNRVPKSEIGALISYSSGGPAVTASQYGTLFDWLDRATPLEFWVNKLQKQYGLYQFGSTGSHLSASITEKRFNTFLTRIKTMAEQKRLVLSADSLVQYADSLCKYGSDLADAKVVADSKSLLFDWINKDHPELAPEVMGGLLRVKSKSVVNLIKEWLSQDGFLAHPHHHALIEQYFLGAVLQSDFDDTTVNIAKDVLNDSRYLTLEVVFKSNLSLEDQVRFAKKLIDAVDIDSKLNIHHLYKLSQSSENARQVFAYNNNFNSKDGIKSKLLKNVGIDPNDSRIKKNLLNSNVKLFFHPSIDQLQLFKQIANDANVSGKVIALFVGLIKDSSIETIRRPEQARRQLTDAHSLLWQLKSKVGESMLGCILGDPTSGLVRVANLPGIDTPVKASALDALLNKLIEIKPSDIRNRDKQEAITKYLENELQYVTNAATLRDAVKAIESQFVHYLLKNRYTDKDAEPWFRQLNPDLHQDVNGNQESKGDIFNEIFAADRIRNARSQILERVTPYVNGVPEGHPAKKFTHIHNTQMQAICAVNELIDNHNLMLRLKTGQGKSLIAEMSAIQVMQRHKNVHTALIVTSYEHLADRDQKNMKFLVDAYGYQSILLENMEDLNKLVESLNQKSIVHVESENLRRLLHHFLADLIVNGIPNDSKAKKQAIFKKLFDFGNLCLVLDEVDLMTWDRDNFSSIYNAASLFGLEAGDILDTQQQNRIKTQLKSGLDQPFHSDFDAWFSSEIGWFQDEKNTGSERISTNDNSGTETHLSDSFGANLKRGKYNFNVFNWDFVSYIRKFKYTVSLSGSITRQSTQFFNPTDGKPGLFDNGKRILFIEFPSFFGPHVDHINLKMKGKPRSSLTHDDWINALVTDIQGAIHHNQPVLVFLDRDEFGTAVEEIKTNLNDSRLKYMTVTSKDADKIEKLVPQIGQANTVTFATVIIGRGVDIVVSSAIEEGLHLSIGMIPFKDKEKTVPNYRLLTQMIGRTARQDKRGSFSIMTKDQFDWASYQDAKVNPPQESLGNGLAKKNKKFDLCVDFYKKFLDDSYSSEGERKAWILIANLMRYGYLDSDEDRTKVRDHFRLNV